MLRGLERFAASSLDYGENILGVEAKILFMSVRALKPRVVVLSSPRILVINRFLGI
jgi:hypothetical protein